MENVTDLKVTQIRIFPVDVVPLSKITTKSCIEKIRETLSISEMDLAPIATGLNPVSFIRGELKEGDRIIVINRVVVDPRRIILEVAGTSKESERVYEALLSALDSIGDIDVGELQVPLLIAEATQCVVTLNFKFESLFNSSFIELLSNRVKKEATNKLAKGSVKPLLAEAEISYQVTGKALVDNGISMSPKKFSIAPRAGVPLEAKRYSTSSPFDSDTHLRLIKELEEAMIKTRAV